MATTGDHNLAIDIGDVFRYVVVGCWRRLSKVSRSRVIQSVGIQNGRQRLDRRAALTHSGAW